MKKKWARKWLQWVVTGALTITAVVGFTPYAGAGEAEQPIQSGLESKTWNAALTASADLQATAAPLTISEVIAKGSNGEAVQVSGYIVGHATGSLTAKFQSPFSNDFNILIADDPAEQSSAKLVDVQIPSNLRAQFGLQSNPGLIGQRVNIAGSLAAYNNFAGLKSVTSIQLVDAEQPGPGGDPGEGQPGEGQPGEGQPGQGEPGEGQPGEGHPGNGAIPALPDGTGKKVLFDNAHAQTAGAADWIIDGAFSDFADGLRAAGFAVESLERATPHQFDTPAITYNRLKDYDVFIIPEANIPFKSAEQDAIVQYVQGGGAVFFIADHYNADRNKNRWDSSEVFNGYRRGAYNNPAKGMSVEEATSPAMQNVISSDWLANQFGVRFRYNALGDVNATDIVAPSQAFGITEGVNAVAMHAGSTLAIIDPTKAKGIVYVPTGVPKWGNAVDSGVYNGGGRAEGPYAAIAKIGLGKAAFIGDSSPVEDATPKYVREENGGKKTTYDGFKEVDDGVFLVQTVKWLAHDESYTSLSAVPGLVLDTPTVLRADENPSASTEPAPEPWSAPAAGYKWYDPSSFKPGSYGSSQPPAVEPVYAFEHQSQLPSAQEFTIRLTADGLNPGQTVTGLKAGIYLSGGEQIARFKNTDGTWSAYGYSPDFSLTGNSQGYAYKDLTVQLKPNQSGAATLRLKIGSANVITKAVTVANVNAETLPLISRSLSREAMSTAYATVYSQRLLSEYHLVAVKTA